MIPLTQEQVDFLQTISGIGFYCEYGAVIGNNEFVIVMFSDGSYSLAHVSDFEINGFFVKLKEGDI